jgi:FkbM family methyltransferase
MDLPLQRLSRDFGIDPGLVIHAGANLCQERFEYDEAGFGPVVWIEALGSISNQARVLLKDLRNQFVIQAALWEKAGVEIPFNISSNNAESSSVFKFKWHEALHPHISTQSTVILKSQLLDDVIENFFEEKIPRVSLLVLDLQGAEYQALLGAKKLLMLTQAIHVEVSRVELYKGQKLFYEINEMLNLMDFILVSHDLTGKTSSGDALFIRKQLVGEVSCMHLPAKPRFPSITFKNFIKFFLIRIGVPSKLIQEAMQKLRNYS